MQPLEGGEPPSPPESLGTGGRVGARQEVRRAPPLRGGGERGDLPAPHLGSSVLVCSVKQEDAEPCLGSGVGMGDASTALVPALPSSTYHSPASPAPLRYDTGRGRKGVLAADQSIRESGTGWAPGCPSKGERLWGEERLVAEAVAV